MSATRASPPQTAPARAGEPSGYLGAEARIRQGPAPELVEAGYELELADAALLERGLTLADVAHVLAHPAIPDDHRRALLDALLDLRSTTRTAATATSSTCASACSSSGSGTPPGG